MSSPNESKATLMRHEAASDSEDDDGHMHHVVMQPPPSLHHVELAGVNEEDGDDVEMAGTHQQQQRIDLKERALNSSLVWGYFWWLLFGVGWIAGLHWAYIALLALRARQK